MSVQLGSRRRSGLSRCDPMHRHAVATERGRVDSIRCVLAGIALAPRYALLGRVEPIESAAVVDARPSKL